VRELITWGVPSAFGGVVLIVATVALAQDAGDEAVDTDGVADTDVPVEAVASDPEPAPVGCAAGQVELGEGCVPLPRLVPFEATSVTLGSPKDEPGRTRDEVLRQVEVGAFALSTSEITQGQFEAIVGDNPSAACGAPVGVDLPVSCVSWHDAVRFCNRLSERMGLTPAYTIEAGGVVWDREADGLRLPTEAEWERAARQDQAALLAGGDLADAVAWYAGNAQGEPHPVGLLRPTVAGVHDLSGNVAEWVWDGFSKDPSQAGPEELDGASVRVQKGGSFADPELLLRVAARDLDRADVVTPTVGFRVAQNASGEPVAEEAPPPADAP